jgi:hypothetical protein
MGRCFALKKDLKRCKNNCTSLFCKSHKYYFWITGFTVIATVGTVAGFYQDFFKPVINSISSKEPEIYVQPHIKKPFCLSSSAGDLIQDSLKSQLDEDFALLSYYVELTLVNTTSEPININNVRSILMADRDYTNEVFNEIKGPFSKSKYSDDVKFDLPYYLEENESLVFYVNATFPICVPLANMIKDKTGGNICNEKNEFADINNLLYSHNELFRMCIVYNELNKKYFEFYISDSLSIVDFKGTIKPSK